MLPLSLQPAQENQVVYPQRQALLLRSLLREARLFKGKNPHPQGGGKPHLCGKNLQVYQRRGSKFHYRKKGACCHAPEEEIEYRVRSTYSLNR